jgi:PAS domain S-box-containing protein
VLAGLWVHEDAGMMPHWRRVLSSDSGRRRRQEEESHELASRLHKIASQLPGVVYQYKLRPDGTSCLPYASERIRDVYGLTPEDVRDDATPILAMIHPDDLPAVAASVQASAEKLEPWELEYRVRSKSGEVRWLYGNATPEREADGSTLWHGFITDITRRKETERQKAQLEEQLRQSQKVESIGRLAGGVAHDFNNLLTSVMGFVELAMSSMVRPSPEVEYLDGALESVRRGAALTQHLLAFARRRIVQPEVISLNRVLQSLAPMIRRLVGENIELVLQLTPELGLVTVDVGSLEQVIVNLVLNARDAIFPRTGKITLETSNAHLDADYCRTRTETVPGDYAMLGVSDTGVGMASEIMARVFEPFFTTKPVGEGTGLGLSICDGIVKQAGGIISVYSEAGRGSTFRVYLPRVVAEETAPRAPPRPLVPARGTETVLVVEDEELILRVAKNVLTGLGYRVLTALDGPRAIEMVEQTREPIHLLITDVVMPQMAGPELAQRMAELRPGIRVLFSSGYTENTIVDHGVLQKGIDFLQKPYSPTILAARVREVLDKA